MLPDFSPTFAAMARTRAASQAGAPGRAVPSGAEGATGSVADEVSGPAAVTREAGADGPEGTAPDPAEVLAAWRARASLTRLQFALVCTSANLMTAAEAEGLVARGEIPAIGLAALDLITDPAQQALARVRFAGFQRLDRLDPAVALLASAAAMLDEDVDALFEAGALL